MRGNITERQVEIHAGTAALEGNLSLPPVTRGVVLFAHGSGSSRFSPRNRYVARMLYENGLGTLLIDLLTRQEETVDVQTRRLRFDIGFLATRLTAALDWLTTQSDTRGYNVGLFGASTGAGAALVAAAERPTQVRAVVSRGGRPDLAGSALASVRAPTLLIVGAHDLPVVALNRQAYSHLQAEKRLQIIPGATHLFEEAGALEEVARLAQEWFTRCLA
jgi:putative phosphoribosyl transferase